MTINKTIIKELEHAYLRPFTDEFKRYLLAKYAEESFPDQVSEQDLYEGIRKDIRNYEAGELDVTVKSLSERWQEERKYLQNLYIEKFNEVRDLEMYVAELECMLSQYGLETAGMIEKRIALSNI